MKLQRHWIVLSLGLALGLIGYVTAHAGHALLASPTAQAVADVQKIYDALDEKRHIDAEMQTRQDNLAAELNKRQTEIKQLQSDLELLPAGGDDFARTQEELERKAIDLQAWGTYEQKKLQREVAIRNERMLRKVIDAVGRVAQDNGYDAVLNPENKIQVPTGNPAQPTRTANLPIVLWNSGQHDITDQVIQLMNNEFANMVSAP